MQDAGLTLRVAAGPGPFMVDADADRIGQVVTNLVGNAIRATPSGGTVTVTCVQSGSWVDVAVADTGVGLAPSDLKQVFERFYRIRERTNTANDSGTGIGLTISRGIVRAHGGDVTAASEGLGTGATFTARLPLAAAFST